MPQSPLPFALPLPTSVPSFPFRSWVPLPFRVLPTHARLLRLQGHRALARGGRATLSFQGRKGRQWVATWASVPLQGAFPQPLLPVRRKQISPSAYRWEGWQVMTPCCMRQQLATMTLLQCATWRQSLGHWRRERQRAPKKVFRYMFIF